MFVNCIRNQWWKSIMGKTPNLYTVTTQMNTYWSLNMIDLPQTSQPVACTHYQLNKFLTLAWERGLAGPTEERYEQQQTLPLQHHGWLGGIPLALSLSCLKTHRLHLTTLTDWSCVWCLVKCLCVSGILFEPLLISEARSKNPNAECESILGIVIMNSSLNTEPHSYTE